MVGGVGMLAVGSLPVSSHGVTLGLCGLTSPDRLAIGLYLDANATELERPAGQSSAPIRFVVEPGESVADIASRLQEAGLVSDGELLRRYLQYHGLDAGIEAGEFTLRQSMTIPEIGQALQQAQRPEQVVTIREGLRLEEVAETVADQTTVLQEEFIALAAAGWREVGLAAEFSFLADLPEDATLEGFLFPDTYRLPEQATATDLLRRMLETFDARVTPEVRRAAADQGLTLYDLVNLASIVEREAVLENERPIIAGVFQNRLSDGWLLESCPTVQYGLGQAGDWWPSLTLDHLELDVPSSTYRRPGLPPNPICSPGLASIQAAAYPADTEYYFFLADCTQNDGSHRFSVTAEEHMINYELCGGGLP